MRPPHAFTIIEILTALVLLAVGLAGFARAAGAVAILERDARLRRAVAESLQARLDSLTGVPCRNDAGTSAASGIAEHWHAVVDSGALVLSDTIIVMAQPRLGRALHTRVGCAP